MVEITEKEQEMVNCILSGQPNDEVIRIINLFREKLKQEYQSLSPRYWYKKVKSKVFRIGHLGDLNDLSLMGALAGVEMGLKQSGIPYKSGGIMAAIDFLSS